MKRMRAEDIPRFIAELIDAGCEPIAVGEYYVIGDTDLPQPASDLEPKVHEITDRYGPRDHLVAEISAYLTSIGRRYVA